MNNCPMCSRWDDEQDLRIAEFGQSRLVLNRDQFFPGYCLLFTRDHVTELFHMDKNVRQQLMEEVNLVAGALFSCFSPTKMNYELIGNMVPHIHWHIVPRFDTELLWPRPVWAEPHEELRMTPEGYRKRCEMIRNALTEVTDGA